MLRGAGDTQVDEELAVYWVNTWNKGALVRQKEEAIVANGSLNIDSFFSHSFLVVDEKVCTIRCGWNAIATAACTQRWYDAV